MDSSDEDAVHRAIETDWQGVKKAKEVWQQASGKKASGQYLPGFFIRIGARYRRIRKRPKVRPSPQFYAYNIEKLQELVQQEKDGLIAFTMVMRVISARMDMCHTDGNSTVKMSTSPVKEVSSSIYSV